MAKMLITYDDEIPEKSVINYVNSVILMGRMSGYMKESYCYHSKFEDGTHVMASVTGTGTDKFVVKAGEKQ